MTYYAHGLGKGGGGGGHGGGHGGGGQGGGGHHGGGHHGGGGHFHGGGFHGGRGRGRGSRGWYGYGYSGPGYVDYVSYSPCDECWSQPPSFVLPCLRYRGCVAPDGLGQAAPATRTVIGGMMGVGLVGAGIAWWLKSRKKRKS